MIWSRSNRITPPSPPASAIETGSLGLISRPRKPTINIRAIRARSGTGDALGAIVTGGELGWVSHVAQAFEFDAFDDAAGVDVEAWDDTAGKRHCTDSKKFCNTFAPVSPDFSG